MSTVQTSRAAAGRRVGEPGIVPFPAETTAPEVPCNLEAERQYLGAVLLDNTVPDRTPYLRPQHFWRDRHQILFKLMLALRAEGKPVDMVMLDEELRRRDQLDAIGGDDGLAEIAEAANHAENAVYHAQVVMQKATTREMILACQTTMEEAYRNDRTAAQILDRHRERIEAIGQEETASRGATDYATLADAAKHVGDTRWFWEGWIPRGVMSLLAAKGGEGKTRLAMDIARRLWFGLPMPDDSPVVYPVGTKTLWILVDSNWKETAEVAESFGVPLESILLNSPRDRPLTVPDFDSPAVMRALKEQIERESPGLVIIDTITYATRHNTSRAEEAKSAFDAIIGVAAETGAPILALTHLNKDGEALGRRITERARSVIGLSDPNPDAQSDRRRLFIVKSATKKPAPLGMTIHTDRMDFDFDPPAETTKEAKPRGPRPVEKTTGLTEWLWTYLQMGPVPVVAIVEAAREKGFLPAPTEAHPKATISPLYRAKDNLPRFYPGAVIEETEALVGERSTRPLKHWAIAKPSGSDQVDQDPVF